MAAASTAGTTRMGKLHPMQSVPEEKKQSSASSLPINPDLFYSHPSNSRSPSSPSSVFTFASSSSSSLPPSSSFPPSHAINLGQPLDMPRSSSYSQSALSPPPSPSYMLHPSTPGPSPSHPYPSTPGSPTSPPPTLPTDSSGRPRFRPYDDPARQAAARRSRFNLFVSHHAVCVVCSVVAIAIYKESTAETQSDAYFTFFQALAILTILTSAMEAARMALQRWQGRMQAQPTATPLKDTARGPPQQQPRAAEGKKKQAAAPPATAASPVPDSLTIDIPSRHSLAPAAAQPTAPATTAAASPAPAQGADAASDSRPLLSRLAAVLPLSRVISSLQLVHLVAFIGIFIMFLVSLLVQSVYWNASDLDLAVLHRAGHLKMWLISLTSLCAVCSGHICVLALNRQWPMPSSWARSILFSMSLLLVSLGVAIVIVNERITNDSANRGNIPQWCFRSMQWTGVLCFLVGVHAASITFTVLQENRERRMFAVLVSIYTRLCLVACAVSLAFTISLLTYYGVADDISSAHINILVNADPILALLLCVLTLASVAVARRLIAPPSSNLRVERFDLSTAHPELLAYWAANIDRHTLDDTAMTGAATLELMALYCQNTLPSVYCICLRMRRPEKGGKKEGKGERGRLVQRVEEVGADYDCEEDDAVTMERERDVKSRATLIATSRAPPSTASPGGPNSPGGSGGPSSLSEKQLKKAMKKDRKKQAKAANRKANGGAPTANGDADDDDEEEPTPSPFPSGFPRPPVQPVRDLAAALAVKAMIAEDDTEALVLLTVVDRYDVTKQVKGWLGGVLTRTLGSGGWSWFQPLVLRMGLLAFQWPFRTSVVFLQPSTRPAGRAAACLRAVVEWNEAQLPADRCDLLLLPSMKVQSALVAAVEPAGFFSLPLPSSHMQDLRPYHHPSSPHNPTTPSLPPTPSSTSFPRSTSSSSPSPPPPIPAWQDYLRAMKKGNRKDLIDAFEMRDGGVVLHVDDSSPLTTVTDERVGDALRLWKAIAVRRTEDMGETATFASPNPTFLTRLASTLSPPHRAFLFLLHDGHVIASAVLFKYPGRLITSDMQGLDHARARPLRAYFVMMQWVIREGLKGGYDWVDFGPTTGQAKVDAGCHEYPLSGGGYARNGLLGWAMKRAAGKVAQSLATKGGGAGKGGEKGGGGGGGGGDHREDEAEVASPHIGPLHTTIHVGPGQAKGKSNAGGEGEGGKKGQLNSPKAAAQLPHPPSSKPVAASTGEAAHPLSPTSGRPPRAPRPAAGQSLASPKAGAAPAGKQQQKQPQPTAAAPPAAELTPSTAVVPAASQPLPVAGGTVSATDQHEAAVVVVVSEAASPPASAAPSQRKGGGKAASAAVKADAAAATSGGEASSTAGDASAPALSKNAQKKLAKAEQARKRAEALEGQPQPTTQPAPPSSAAAPPAAEALTVESPTDGPTSPDP